MSERDVLFEQRRPAAARRIADLLAVGVERHAHAPGGAWQARGEADLGVKALERIPLELDADELPLRTALLFGGERLPADEALLVETHGPGEVELEGRRKLAVDERLARRDVVDVDQHQAGFDARDVERQHAGRHDAVAAAGIHQRVPQRERMLAIGPDLEAQIAGVAGARDSDRDAAQSGGGRAGRLWWPPAL